MNGDPDEFGFPDESAFDGQAHEPDFTDDLPFDAEGDWDGDADSDADFDDIPFGGSIFDDDPFDTDPFDTDDDGFFSVGSDAPWFDGSDETEQFVVEARNLREAGNAADAVDLLRDNLEADGPWDAPAHVELGLALDALGDHGPALEAFRRAVELDPNEPHTLNHLGAALHERGNDREAIEQFAAANERDATFMPGIVNRILCHAELGEHDHAEAMFYLAQQHDERCPRSFFNMGRSLELRGLHRRAIWCYRRCLALDTSEPMVPRGAVVARLAACLRADGQRAIALRCLREGIGRTATNDPARPELLEQLAEMLLDADDPDSARPVLEALTQLTPQSPATLSLWGRLHRAAGDLDAAADALALAAAGDPTFPRVHLQLAELAAGRGDFGKAQRHLRAELLRRPRDTDVLRAVADQARSIADHAGHATALRKLLLVMP
ncbi:MAG: tetratricopeptide repeat protein, partial [Planctomycetota bacterium]